MPRKKISVLIVEDTLVAQQLLKGIVLSDDRFELLGTVVNGKQAVDFVKKFQPDVVSMDISMPVMDGVEATRQIMRECPVPVVIVSNFFQSSEIDMTITVMQAGAVSFISIPYGPNHPEFNKSARQYLNTLLLMSEIKVVKRRNVAGAKIKPVQTIQPDVQKTDEKEYKILAIGASAGGPEGLATILSGLPADFPLPVCIVQHVDSHFSEGFVTWLNGYSKLPVHIAVNGQKILPGNVYFPPGDYHLLVAGNGTIAISKDLLPRGLRPSVSVLFNSIANVFGGNSIAVLLSGMGKDGAAELKLLFDLGAFTMVQSEPSCLVYGMPGEAVKLGAACKILAPSEIVAEINRLINL